MTKDESECNVREDGIHCDCWWDGFSCCACDAPAMTVEELIEQNMIEKASDFEEYWREAYPFPFDTPLDAGEDQSSLL